MTVEASRASMPQPPRKYKVHELLAMGLALPFISCPLNKFTPDAWLYAIIKVYSANLPKVGNQSLHHPHTPFLQLPYITSTDPNRRSVVSLRLSRTRAVLGSTSTSKEDAEVVVEWVVRLRQLEAVNLVEREGGVEDMSVSLRRDCHQSKPRRRIINLPVLLLLQSIGRSIGVTSLRPWRRCGHL